MWGLVKFRIFAVFLFLYLIFLWRSGQGNNNLKQIHSTEVPLHDKKLVKEVSQKCRQCFLLVICITLLYFLSFVYGSCWWRTFSLTHLWRRVYFPTSLLISYCYPSCLSFTAVVSNVSFLLLICDAVSFLTSPSNFLYSC